MKKLYLILCLYALMLFNVESVSAVIFSDDFEDGGINSTLWVVGGVRTSYLSQPAGNWQASHTETGGSLQTKVWGPASGATYGYYAWVRTTYNFNDGQSYKINFTWEPLTDNWADYQFIQITDGYAPEDKLYHYFAFDSPPETTNLLWYEQGGTPIDCWPTAKIQELNGQGITQLSMSISITPDGTARLYDSPDLTGNLLWERILNPSVEWYLRFMISDATSAGFGAGDSGFNLYDIEAEVIPEPATILLLTLGGLALRRL
jgi:hypothetical protein